MNALRNFLMYFCGISLCVWGVLILACRLFDGPEPKTTVEVPDEDLLEPQDMVEHENVCPVTGEKHRWKSLGYDKHDNHWSQCRDCGESCEQ